MDLEPKPDPASSDPAPESKEVVHDSTSNTPNLRALPPKEGASDTNDYAEGIRELKARFKTYLITSLCVALDLTFLTVWVALIKADTVIFKYIGTLPGVGNDTRNALEFLFDSATMGVIVIYLIHDVRQSVRRIWQK
jgi:hypothetical protein